MLKRRLLFLCNFLSALVSFQGTAQEMEHVWAFGFNAGIDFNTNPPTPVRTGINTNEGCASVCDDNGRLLFYTDGTSVWDRNNNRMPGGSDLTETGMNITASTAQGALIVPVPGFPDQYYIFSLGQRDLSYAYYVYSGKLYYSIVDMALNNGLGDVLTKGIVLDSSLILTEHMTGVSGNDCNIWLIVAPRSTNNFNVYNIDANGINRSPVTSLRIPGEGAYNGDIGSMDVSSDRSKLAIGQGKDLILYDFDPTSGKISHPVILANTSSNSTFYGVCFSPDNTKLYASQEGTGIYQLDLDADDPVSSKILISDKKGFAIKRGPNGKVYSAEWGQKALHVINQPNLAGAACQFVAGGYPLGYEAFSIYGLPNLGTIALHKRNYSTTTDSALCSGPRALSAKNITGQNYVWEDSTLGPTRTVDKQGTYWVRYRVPVNTPCMYEIHVDTFKVVFARTTQNITTTTQKHGICKADTLHLKALNLSGKNYIWENSTAGKSRDVHLPGNYWVSYQVDSLCEFYKDHFMVTYPARDYKVAFTADTFVCTGDPLSFRNISDTPYHNFTWFFGNGISAETQDAEHTYPLAGNYEVMLTGSSLNGRCRDTAYQSIIVDSPLSAMFNVFPKTICVGESINIRHTLTDSSLRQLYWTFGDSTYASISDTILEHHYEQPGMMYIRLNARYRACPDTGYMDSISVHPLPQVNLGADSLLCLHGKSIELQNQYSYEEGYKYLWNTGETTASIRVEHPGTYWLLISNAVGCSAQESIIVTKDCYIDIPNAFTPNGDGVNDYFFPRQQLSKSITTFHMQVFNRWGQQVFETRQSDGRGWDGTYNGAVQPSGVYLYMIEVTIDGRTEKYQGNVTLIR